MSGDNCGQHSTIRSPGQAAAKSRGVCPFLRRYCGLAPTTTEHRLCTLMHDPQYRVQVAAQNVTYNQPPHPSFYFGEGMKAPPKPNLPPAEPKPAQ
jgi:hypothetical protein